MYVSILKNYKLLRWDKLVCYDYIQVTVERKKNFIIVVVGWNEIIVLFQYLQGVSSKCQRNIYAIYRIANIADVSDKTFHAVHYARVSLVKFQNFRLSKWTTL